MNADKLIQLGCPQRNAICKPRADAKYSEWAKKLTILRSMIESGRGVTVGLIGIRGNGKTQVAAEIMRDHIAAEKTSLYVTAQAFFLELRASFRPGSPVSESKVVEKYRRPLFLTIDECEKRGGSEWENTVLFGLLDMRHGDMSDTLLIANQTVETFASSVGPSVMSRISDGGAIFEFSWEDFRFENAANEKPLKRGFIEPPYSLKPGDAGYDWTKDPNHKPF